MTAYALTYVLVKGAPLTRAEHDANIHNLDDRIVVLEDAFESPNQVISIDLVGLDLVFTMEDYSTFNAGELPVVEWRPRGTWTALTSYTLRDLVTIGGAVYKVAFSHTSDAEFDPGANNGMGDDYYELIFEVEPAPPRVSDTSDGAISTLLSLADTYTRCSSLTGTEVTILADASMAVAHDIGSELHFRQCEADAPITFLTETGVTLNWKDEFYDQTTSAKGAVVTLKKVAADEWDLFGDLVESSSV